MFAPESRLSGQNLIGVSSNPIGYSCFMFFSFFINNPKNIGEKFRCASGEESVCSINDGKASGEAAVCSINDSKASGRESVPAENMDPNPLRQVSIIGIQLGALVSRIPM